MKIKLLLTTALLGLTLAFPHLSLASSISVKIFQPKSPTNKNSFDLSFTALDTENLPITVKCYKKGPGDSGFTQFGGDQNLKAGGNSGFCTVDSSVMGTNNNGTYYFYVTASDSSPQSQTSSTVAVDYNTSGPGTPNSYSKEKISSCVYRIKFHTADDGGKTIKVQLFRSDTTTISIDGNGMVDTLSIGSNQDGQFDNGIPDCNKEYYYELRAVDSYGNVSGIIGDSFTTTVIEEGTTTTNTTVQTTPGAVNVGQSSQVAASNSENQTGSGTTGTPSGEPTGTIVTPSPSPSILGAETTRQQFIKWAILILVLAAGFFLLKSSRKAIK